MSPTSLLIESINTHMKLTELWASLSVESTFIVSYLKQIWFTRTVKKVAVLLIFCILLVGFAFVNCAVPSSSENSDTDGDGVVNAQDNCPNAANPDQSDIDSDGIGDSCSPNYASTVLEIIM